MSPAVLRFLVEEARLNTDAVAERRCPLASPKRTPRTRAASVAPSKFRAQRNNHHLPVDSEQLLPGPWLAQRRLRVPPNQPDQTTQSPLEPNSDL